MIAVSRLMLDNFPNIKAYWIMISTPLAQVALHYGANDIQGTVMEEKIAHAAGAVTPQEEKMQDLVTLIRDAGRIPVQRDTLYNTVRTFADPARPHLLRQHGAGLLRPGRRRASSRCRACRPSSTGG